MINEIAEFIICLATNPHQCEIFSKNSLAASEMYTPVNAMKFVKEY
jgi:hypothetical protein